MEEHESVDSHTGEVASVTGDPPPAGAEPPAPPNEAGSAPASEGKAATPPQPLGSAVETGSAPTSEGKDPAPPEDEGGLDPQLIALCVVLWIVAMGVFAFQWKGMRTDYYLGNVKEGLELENQLDQESLEALVALATDDPEVLEQLRKELESPQRVNQQYRIAVLVAIDRVPGAQALELVAAAARDYDPRVRSNAYKALSRRVREGAPEERERAYEALVGGLQDPDPQARAFAANFLGEAGDRRAVWPLIKLLRQSEGDAGLAPREVGLRALRQLTGVEDDALAFDPKAARAERDRGLRAWEAWFRGQGGAIPAGESLDEVRAAEPAPEAVPVNGVDGSEGAGGPNEQPGGAPQNAVEGIPNGG